MRLYKRKGSPHWWFDYSVRGRRVRGSSGTDDRAVADQIASKLRTDDLLSVTTGRRPSLTLDQAFAKWWLEHGQYLRTEFLDGAAKNLLARLGKGTHLEDIDDAFVSKFIALRRAEVSDSSVNRDVALLRAVIRSAERKWKVAVGSVNWSMHRLNEPDGRERFLTPDEADRLLAAAAPHLRPVIATALYTGLRRGNVLRLNWSQVDLQSRFITVSVKSKRPGGKKLSLPIATPLVTLLANLGPRSEGPVFTLHGEALGSIKTAFKAACRRAGIKGLRFHDLRHTAASWMIQSGTPLDVVQKILGHSDIKLTQRYAHRAPGAALQAVESLASVWRSGGTIAAQSPPLKKAKA